MSRNDLAGLPDDPLRDSHLHLAAALPAHTCPGGRCQGVQVSPRGAGRGMTSRKVLSPLSFRAKRGIPETRCRENPRKKRLAPASPCQSAGPRTAHGYGRLCPLGVWCSGPTRCPVKAETAGSNPVIPAEPPGPHQAVVFRERSLIAALRSLDTMKSAMVISAVSRP